tara:strand:+ start:8564 stop:9529 length:966 start_codon:yes stop_codon:yes gene_type:complete
MKNIVLFGFLLLFYACKENQPKTRYLPESSGNINDITVVMSEKSWNGFLGHKTRILLSEPYQGLPFDEPEFSIKFIPEKVFTGFTRNSRNIIWFSKDSIGNFMLSENLMAKPQLVAKIGGEDEEVQAFYLEENIALLKATITEIEQTEKLRRIKKSPSKDKELLDRFNIKITYPTAYKTFKDTVNFTWIQKPLQKGHMNLIAYTLPLNTFKGNIKKRIPAVRDSIGKVHVPGRLPGSYMITERAYRPYFYKTSINGKMAYLTKGTWEVANDFMAGPFVNYMIKDTLKKRWMVIEGFTFAPSASKRDYMFELNTILSSIKFK